MLHSGDRFCSSRSLHDEESAIQQSMMHLRDSLGETAPSAGRHSEQHRHRAFVNGRLGCRS
ncbi:unnamed protein product [Ectocarpus sp. 13 AM-2016]